MYLSTPCLARSGRGDEFPGVDAVQEINGKPPFYLLAGLAHEVVRRIADREEKPDALLRGPTEEDVEDLCWALMAGKDATMAEAIISSLSENTSTEMIYLRYLAPAARKLGDWWVEDRASFFEVTTAIGRVFELLRKMAVDVHTTSETRELTVVFASVPGEQHTLGIRMAADLFRSDGWEIALKIGLSKEELVAEIGKLPRCIVALSIGGRHSLDKLFDVVTALRVDCPQAAVVVSGQGIEDIRPSLSEMGLESVASEISRAKEQISALWDRETAREALALRTAGKIRC